MKSWSSLPLHLLQVVNSSNVLSMLAESIGIPKSGKIIDAYPADIVLALCGDGLIDHFLAANAEENFFNLVQKFLQKQNTDITDTYGPSAIS